MGLLREFRRNCTLIFKRLQNNTALYWLLVGCLAGLILFRLFINVTVPLELWDEQTNANVVAGLISGDGNNWDLKLAGADFFEKPPLWYYLTAGVVKVFGYNNVSLRLVSALSGAGIAIFIFLTARKFFSPWKSLATLLFFVAINQLFVINPGNYFSTHTLSTADLDALQFFFLTAAQYSFFCVMQDRLGKYKIKLIYFSYFFLALAFMTKGPLALLPMILMTYYYWKNRSELLLNKKIFLKILILLTIIILPWHIYMLLKFGWPFLNTYFIYHIVERGIVPLESHNEPWYFYLGLLFNFQINLCWPILYWRIFKQIKNHKLNLLQKYNIIFAIILLVGITLSQTKLAWYMLYLWLLLIQI